MGNCWVISKVYNLLFYLFILFYYSLELTTLLRHEKQSNEKLTESLKIQKSKYEARIQLLQREHEGKVEELMKKNKELEEQLGYLQSVFMK